MVVSDDGLSYTYTTRSWSKIHCLWWQISQHVCFFSLESLTYIQVCGWYIGNNCFRQFCYPEPPGRTFPSLFKLSPVVCLWKLTLSQRHRQTIFLPDFIYTYIYITEFSLFLYNFNEDLIQLCIFKQLILLWRIWPYPDLPKYTLENHPWRIWPYPDLPRYTLENRPLPYIEHGFSFIKATHRHWSLSYWYCVNFVTTQVFFTDNLQSSQTDQVLGHFSLNSVKFLAVYDVANDPWPSHEKFHWLGSVICFWKLTLSQWHMRTILCPLYTLLNFPFLWKFIEDLMQLCIFKQHILLWRIWPYPDLPKYTFKNRPLPYVEHGFSFVKATHRHWSLPYWYCVTLSTLWRPKFSSLTVCKAVTFFHAESLHNHIKMKGTIPIVTNILPP